MLVRAGLEIRFRRLPSWCDGYRAGPARAARRASPRPRPPRRPPPRRHVRPGRHRPAHLSDRPLQPPLHLLHARRRPRLDATRRAAHRRRARPAHHDRRARPRRPRAALHRRRTAAAPRPRATSSRRRRPCGRVRTSRSPPTASASPAAPKRWPRRASTGSTSRWTRCGPTGSPRITRRDRLADVLAVSPPPAPPGLDPVKINTVLMRGVNDDEAVPPAAVRHRPGLRAAVHRADAAGRPARLAARGDGDRRGDHGHAPQRRTCSRPTRPSAAALRPSGGLSTAAPRMVGVIASVTRPFCGACDRTRLTADGQSVRASSPARDRPARAAARRGVRRRDRRRVARRRCGASSPATASTTPVSCSRTAR